MLSSRPHVALVDFGLGNLHNVRRACAHVGLNASITCDPHAVLDADAVILPGVGAMPAAMRALEGAGLPDVLREVAARGTPLLGVCLGLQLLMSHGTEFGDHEGLGIFPGTVTRFPRTAPDGSVLKVPHISWSPIYPPAERPSAWEGTILSTTPAATQMYFVHSYHAVPDDRSLVTASAAYNGIEFVAAVARDNILACQFHPERSGPDGLEIYNQFALRIHKPAVKPGG